MGKIAITGFQIDYRAKSISKKYPVKLRVTHKRQPRLYSIKCDFRFEKKEELERVLLGKFRNDKDAENVKQTLDVIKKRADSIIKDLDHLFSFDHFKERFYSDTKKQTDVAALFNQYIKELTQDGKPGTADSYKYARDSFQNFVGKNRKVDFRSITVKWLKKYQKWMELKGKSSTTIGIYSRCMRSIYNNAIEEGIISKESYPFGSKKKKKFTPPHGVKKKLALTTKELSLLANYVPNPGSWEEIAKDLFIFSYLCNGINMKDICRLKNKNLSKDKIRWIRAKTVDTNETEEYIEASRTEILNDIMKKHGELSLNPEAFIFKFLKGNETPEEEQAKVKQVTKNCNKWLGRIAEKVKIEKKVTTYYARHSFGSTLKNGDVPIEHIRELMGHSSSKVTRDYLDSLPDEKLQKVASLLERNMQK